ncbi:B12-binding domain-containing radical SAM protein [Pseudochryseolinea flava]|uniref:Radical SAM protein n=1 Tax=Pseudochryseolinea flava TaxID=2059302 RepID=A0A364Y768_9BACT|nr:radical SAM protein [Pseudochryseolinea flava]RAW02743.1 radical SAM protein [Pseudochryseolinea flava]
MKGSVLFTHSYFYKLDPKQWRFKQPYAPLATLLAAAVIRDAGFNVSMFDTGLKDSPSEIIPSIRSHKPEYLVIYDDGFNYLTKMCLTNMREAAFMMTKIGKRFGCTVIVSSSDSSDHYEKYLQNGADYVVRGEGEETLKELLLALKARKTTSELAGIAYLRGLETVVNPARPVMRELDHLPLPAWDLVDLDPYRKIWIKHHGYFSVNLATTRGCPYKCNWCAKPIYGNRYNSRSPQHVIREIEMLLSQYKPDHFWMSDDIFGLKPGWVQEFNKLVNAKKLSFKYKIQSRVDLLLEEDNLAALAESGAETIWVGAESGSQAILDAMDKGTKVEQIYTAARLMKEKNIRVAFFLQFGYLGETKDDIDATIRMVLDLMPDEIGISVSYPLPGTKFYEKVKGQLKDKQNWSDSDDLALMFSSTFNNQYYKELHRYVHSVYRKHKGYDSLGKLFANPLRLTYKDVRAGLATLYYLPASLMREKKLKKLQTAE